MQLEIMFMKHYAPNRCEPSIDVIMKMGVQWGVFFFFFFFFGGGGVGGGVGGGGGNGGCERRSEVILKIKKKSGEGGGGQVRVAVKEEDVNEELKFL